MNDAEKEAFSSVYVRWMSSDDMESPYEYFWKAALEWRDSQVGEPAMYQCRMQPTWTDRQPWTNWAECTKGTYEDCKRVRVNGDWRYESRALYTSPPTAQINRQFVEALEKIVAIEDKYNCGDWDEIEEAREIAKAALAAAKK